MTRTERSAFPRAVVRDRSLSRTGLDKSIRKNGGGQHNWGRITDDAKFAALEDEELDDTAELAGIDNSSKEHVHEPGVQGAAGPFSNEDVVNAKQFRRMAFKNDDIDLTAIARTSAAVSHSPPSKTISI